jgi:hypothetical protein
MINFIWTHPLHPFTLILTAEADDRPDGVLEVAAICCGVGFGERLGVGGGVGLGTGITIGCGVGLTVGLGTGC